LEETVMTAGDLSEIYRSYVSCLNLGERIETVWSIIDKAAIEAQL
jgi:hypothetical protein